MDEKIIALAQFLEIEPENIKKSYMENLYSINNEEYLVLDEDEREETAKNEVKNFIEEVGPQYINGYEKFVDKEYFYDMLKESEESYCKDIKEEKSETFANRLIEECYDNDLIDEDDFNEDENGEINYLDCKYTDEKLIDKYAEYLTNDQDPLDYVNSIYTGNELYEYYPNAFDIEELIDYVIREDGYGHVISSYDGKEHEYGDYYIYRIN